MRAKTRNGFAHGGEDNSTHFCAAAPSPFHAVGQSREQPLVQRLAVGRFDHHYPDFANWRV
jgi:hypothetical protein